MDAPSATVKTCLNVLKKTPPAKSSVALSVLKNALASNQDSLNELMQRVVEFPLQSAEDPSSGRRFLLCEFNRHLNSYRSPFSGKFVPPLSGDHQHLSDSLRTFELHANEVWDAYTQLYYGKDALGSVYVKDAPASHSHLSFTACFLVQKDVENDERLAGGKWNSAHIVQVGKVVAKGQEGSFTKYKLHSSVWIVLDPTSDTCLSGHMSRETEETVKVAEHVQASHLENIGKLIESIEIDMRSNLDVVAIPNTRKVVDGLRQKPLPGGGRGPGIPIMIARPRQTGTTKKKTGLPPGAVAMPGMGGAHAAALNAAVLKRAPKK